MACLSIPFYGVVWVSMFFSRVSYGLSMAC